MNNSFGLDIGTSTMKALFLQSDKNEIKFKSCITAKAPVRGMLSDASLDQEEIAQTIRQMIQDAKIPVRSVHLALSDNHVFSKVVEMPSLSEKELASAIYWEAEQHIPVPLSTINLDWKILRRGIGDPKSPKMQILLIGAPLNVLKKYERIFELAGINIESLETETLSVTRCLVNSVNMPNSLIVNIGSLGTTIAVIQSGILVFLYSIPLGGIALNRSIASEFGFSNPQAEEYKKTYGMETGSYGSKIRIAIEPVLMSMITEIKKAISFYKDKYKEEAPIKQIILTGGTAQLPGIIPIFVQHTGVETIVANPWKTQAIQNVPPDLTAAGPEYTIAVGLAIK